MALLISNDPLAPRQRLSDPSRPPSGQIYLADAAHRVVARARIAKIDRGWIELADIEKVEPFRLWTDDETILAYNPEGPSRQAAERPDQRRFRARLMEAYRGRCAVTGCDVPQLLDAAHLRPWRLGGEGVLLRTDLHRMIDTGLAQIQDGRFRLMQPVSGYERYDGVTLRRPRNASHG